MSIVNISIRFDLTDRKYMIIAHIYFMRAFIIVRAHIVRAYFHDVDGYCFVIHSFIGKFIYSKTFSAIFQSYLKRSISSSTPIRECFGHV